MTARTLVGEAADVLAAMDHLLARAVDLDDFERVAVQAQVDQALAHLDAILRPPPPPGSRQWLMTIPDSLTGWAR